MKTKIFLASSPYHPNNNLFEFYSKLRSDENIELIHPASVKDFSDEDLKEILITDYELANRDRLEILESSIVIIDWDSDVRNAYLYWSCINPNSKTIIVSRLFPSIDTFCSEKVLAIVKPEILLATLYSYLSSMNPEAVVQDKEDPVLD